MNIQKIVITGGPCAGKTTAMNRIKETFEKEGYVVLFIAETATELISSGVSPWTCRNKVIYQKLQMKLQMEKEKVYMEAAKSMGAENVLIVCDRGALDNKAYVSEEGFKEVLDYSNETEESLMKKYDAIFHLETAAKGAVEFYTTDNNSARTETPEEAAAIDDKLIDAWKDHPYLKIIANNGDFDTKMKQLIDEMRSFLER